MAPALSKHALRILGAALKAADPTEAVLRHVRRDDETLIAGRRRYPLKNFRNVYVVGAGKAGSAMARAIERVLGKRIISGFVNVNKATATLRRIELQECGHPIPDARGAQGARHIRQIAQDAGPGDILICLISGGASALLPLPAPPITLKQKQQTTQLLLNCGADIHELNCIRKHISLLKGGQLARLAYPATVLTLILSDVIGDDLDVIGSGPTVPDHSTFAGARAILEKYGIQNKVPREVRDRLNANAPETPKPSDKIFERVQNLIVGSNRLAVDAAAREARMLGYRTLLLSTFIEGETRDVARVHAAIAKEVRASGQPIKPPACIISGGETTVTVRGKGQGGRNQEFALAAAIDIAYLKNVVILSAGTDGIDGPTDAAGAFADGTTISQAEALDMDANKFLSNNDSYHFFDPLGTLIKTGPTGTNVADIRLILIS
jgi:glycerate 2-kinase